MILSISSAANPWLFGGNSDTVHPRYVVEMGSTHSLLNNRQNLCRVNVPPCRFDVSMICRAIWPL